MYVLTQERRNAYTLAGFWLKCSRFMSYLILLNLWGHFSRRRKRNLSDYLKEVTKSTAYTNKKTSKCNTSNMCITLSPRQVWKFLFEPNIVNLVYLGIMYVYLHKYSESQIFSGSYLACGLRLLDIKLW